MRRITWVVITFIAAGACAPTARGTATGGPDAAALPDDNTSCETRVSGTVFAPNGTLPLYNVMVYVPASDPPPFAPGVACGRCTTELPGGALASATSDATGHFTLYDVPAGDAVPLVVTTGKWRRRLTVPVAACRDTALADGVVRLPRDRTEGELPKIAMVNGGCDGLACVLSHIGIAPTEFGADANGPQAVTFYNGVGGSAPGSPQPAEALWGNADELAKFDVVVNACECATHVENKTNPDLLRAYADRGGRVYGSHFQYAWTKDLIPAWHATAAWLDDADPVPGPARVDTTQPAGNAFASWLVAVGASSTFGEMPLGDTYPNASVVTSPTTRWLYSDATPEITHYLSFQTPVGAPADQQCGKVVYAGMHVSSGSVSASFPAGCNTAFTPDEKALVFLLFDLQACDAVIF